MNRLVIYISDSTGITAETLGHSLLTQFSGLEFEAHTFRYIDSLEKAQQAAALINKAAQNTGLRPIVFSTLIDPVSQAAVADSQCLFIDFMQAFIAPLAEELGQPARPAVGHSHGVVQEQAYQKRMSAVNFALQSDDGVGLQNYDQAGVILLGVSRSGKTPTCVYLALHYGIYAANYPLVEEDLERIRLPEILQPRRRKLFGLTISAERLHSIRKERRPDSEYSSLRQCQYELRQVEALYRQFNIPYLNVTTMSVEEIATSIMARTGLENLRPGPDILPIT
ncbi:MAG: kinase/pyrophosphorylase [Gammaproteobacteria bacterium]|nr:kinase/pyrophosphorylase [Gammaproteobacteria bacterium]MDH5651057.1 kinase/pyrophosphorylase [Gammaproteobacteria bacterium]